MKKQIKLTILLTVLMSMVGTRVFAHDIEVANNDGVMIYYNYTNDGTELAVTYRGSSYDEYSNEYSGNVVIPEEVTYMSITRKVTSIVAAFCNCDELTSVTIPNSVTSIGILAFYGCRGLTSVTIPNSVTSIGDYAFQFCSGLTSVTIPNSVTYIGKAAFYCGYLTTVISLIENPFAIAGISFYYMTFPPNTFDNVTLYVPKGTIDKYKATMGWKDFLHIEESEFSGITNIGREGGKELIRYTLDGKLANSSHKGISIIQMDNGTTKKVVVK